MSSSGQTSPHLGVFTGKYIQCWDQNANIRRGPGFAHNGIGSVLSPGQVVDVYEQRVTNNQTWLRHSRGGWTIMFANNTAGAQILKLVKEESPIATYTALSRANVRSGPSLDHQIVNVPLTANEEVRRGCHRWPVD